MAIKGLECYTRRLVTTAIKLGYNSSKGKILIFPGQTIGIRTSFDKKKLRLIINDEINKVYTLSGEDIKYLIENSELLNAPTEFV